VLPQTDHSVGNGPLTRWCIKAVAEPGCARGDPQSVSVGPGIPSQAAGVSLMGMPPMSATSLTPRQREILSWAAQGKSAKEIAEILGITPRTVEKLMETVLRELGAANRTHAVAIPLRNKLID
jgi:DNA-binding CsgD family transcriptional regulator